MYGLLGVINAFALFLSIASICIFYSEKNRLKELELLNKKEEELKVKNKVKLFLNRSKIKKIQKKKESKKQNKIFKIFNLNQIKKIIKYSSIITICSFICLIAFADSSTSNNISENYVSYINDEEEIIDSNDINEEETIEPIDEEVFNPYEEYIISENDKNTIINNIPQYTGKAFIELNNNNPMFDESDFDFTDLEHYSELDSLGRCGVAIAKVSKEIMPTEERGEIGSVKPSGWHTVKYQGIDGNYLYNRCHLIGYQLSGENANEKNLITGTRYLNIEGMQPFEDKIANYVKTTNNSVLYKVTPIFENKNLIASGVLMEGLSLEDDGSGIKFCVYCYNVQPNIEIDYLTGESKGPEYIGNKETTTKTKENISEKVETSEKKSESTVSTSSSEQPNQVTTNVSMTYVLNTNTKKFHRPNCSSVSQMSEKNKSYSSNRDEIISKGYKPCQRCNP